MLSSSYWNHVLMWPQVFFKVLVCFVLFYPPLLLRLFNDSLSTALCQVGNHNCHCICLHMSICTIRVHVTQVSTAALLNFESNTPTLKHIVNAQACIYNTQSQVKTHIISHKLRCAKVSCTCTKSCKYTKTRIVLSLVSTFHSLVQ